MSIEPGRFWQGLACGRTRLRGMLIPVLYKGKWFCVRDYLELFLTFAKIGSVTFGGGYAMLPILERECVEKRGWVTEEDLADYFAIGQCTPGIIAVNVSTFVGNKRKGPLGGVVATVGFAFVPIILLSLIAAGLGYLLVYPVVRSAFAGIRVCVCVLILNAVLRLWKKSILDKKTLAIFAVIFLLSVFGDLLPIGVSPAVYVVAAAAAGIALKRPEGGR